MRVKALSVLFTILLLTPGKWCTHCQWAANSAFLHLFTYKKRYQIKMMCKRLWMAEERSGSFLKERTFGL